MGSEAEEAEQSSAPTLALFSLPSIKPPDDYAEMGMVTPPHHTASVPFRWEEEPGKPRPCKALSLPTTTTNTPFKGLELPPRLLYESKFTKTPSPTTVLEGPYAGRSLFHSFRLVRNREVPFDGGQSGGSSPEKGLLGAVVHSKRALLQKKERAGLLGSWRKTTFSLKQGKKEVVDEGSLVFSNFSDCAGDDGGCGREGDGGEVDTRVEVTRITRKRSLLGLTKSRSNFWATIYGAMKQVIPSSKRSTSSKQKN